MKAITHIYSNDKLIKIYMECLFVFLTLIQSFSNSVTKITIFLSKKKKNSIKKYMNTDKATQTTNSSLAELANFPGVVTSTLTHSCY